MCVIQFLYSCSAGDRHLRAVIANCRNALLDGGEGATYAANTIMDLWRTVDRDDDVIEDIRNALLPS